MHLNIEDLKLEKTVHILVNTQPQITFKHC